MQLSLLTLIRLLSLLPFHVIFKLSQFMTTRFFFFKHFNLQRCHHCTLDVNKLHTEWQDYQVSSLLPSLPGFTILEHPAPLQSLFTFMTAQKLARARNFPCKNCVKNQMFSQTSVHIDKFFFQIIYCGIRFQRTFALIILNMYHFLKPFMPMKKQLDSSTATVERTLKMKIVFFDDKKSLTLLWKILCAIHDGP